MSVLSLPATGNSKIYVSGEVDIDETATIAPGVILQATDQGRIIIKAGACLGMGTVLTANAGSIEIGEGAILGAGVLVVGYGKIGDQACVGTASTLIQTSVAAMTVIPPGSLFGDDSRQGNPSPEETPAPSPNPTPENNGSHADEVTFNNNLDPPSSFTSPPAESNGSDSDEQEAVNQNSNSPEETSSSQKQSPSNTTIYGQTHIERLMVTLFPHKENFKKKE
ncbi:UNVERIFIED_CONTAM: transferase [Euhalothece sp. KZN 001]